MKLGKGIGNGAVSAWNGLSSFGKYAWNWATGANRQRPNDLEMGNGAHRCSALAT